MYVEDHSTGVVSCDGLWVRIGIIQELSNQIGHFLCDVGLLYENDVQYHWHGGVYRTRIVEESYRHLLHCIVFRRGDLGRFRLWIHSLGGSIDWENSAGRLEGGYGTCVGIILCFLTCRCQVCLTCSPISVWCHCIGSMYILVLPNIVLECIYEM